jgi:YggT family protein
LQDEAAAVRVRSVRILPYYHEAFAMQDVLMPLIIVVNYAIELLKLVVLASIVMSWLVTFNVLNTRNRAVYMIVDTLYRITEPVLRPIRRIMPNTGAVDLSPIALFFILWLIQMYLPMIARGLS